MSDTEKLRVRYNGLTIADKPELLDAQANGAEWVIAQWGGKAFGYKEKPKREEITDECCYGSYFEWSAQDGDYEIELGSMPHPLVSYQNTEPVNIDIALAQIAEMESKQKELLSEKASEKGCLTNRDKWMQLWNESDEILARQFVQQEWYGTQWCVYMFSEEPISRHDKWEDAIQAAITALHSPYTEGDADEG